ncbi:unnamed protein product [Rhizophagus irregularis]|nr:unnamed protein product [Rhizophagus irregularis]
MDIDDKIENENSISQKIDSSSRDTNNVEPTTPIIASQDAMDTDQHITDPSTVNSQGSTSTQTTSDANNDVNTQTIEIFKDYSSCCDSEYILFFMRNQFDKEKSNNEILNDLKNAFLMENDIIEYKPVKKATIEFFTITINKKETYDRLKEKAIPLLNNIVPQIYSRDTIDQIISEQLDSLKARSINFLNVPINYDVNLLIKHIANFTNSAIDSYKEFILNKCPNLRNLPAKARLRFRSPTYKKVTLTFNKPNAVNYLLTQHKWGILIENFLIRIVPIDENKPEFKDRTTPNYVVTGIPLNANVLDMLPLTDHLKARSIEFRPTGPNSLHKIANIYCNVTDKDFTQYIKFDTNFQGFKLHIYQAQDFNLNNTCGYCGDANHNLFHCTEKDYTIIPQTQEKRYRKKFIKRQNSYNLNDEIKNSYDQIKSLTTSQRNRPQTEYSQRHGRSNTQDRPNNNRQRSQAADRYNTNINQNRQRQRAIPNANLYNWDEPPMNRNKDIPLIPKGKQPVSLDNSNDELIKRITKLETIIKDMERQLKGLRIKEKEHTEAITLLQAQERNNAINMEKLNQHLQSINNGMNEQKEIIKGVPKIVGMLETMERNGFFEQHTHYQNEAYGNDNYTYPPHNEFMEEQAYNDEYAESNSGYESTGTVETHDIFPDPNYTPSRNTGGYPTITTSSSSLSNRFSNMIGFGQRKE